MAHEQGQTESAFAFCTNCEEIFCLVCLEQQDGTVVDPHGDGTCVKCGATKPIAVEARHPFGDGTCVKCGHRHPPNHGPHHD